MRFIMILLPIAGGLWVASGGAQTPAAVETAPAAYRTVPQEYRLDGVVEAVNQTTVSAQIQGQVADILYDVNDFVEKSAVLVRLKDIEYRARITQAAAELKSATAQLQQRKDEFARVQDLFARKLSSASAMDDATAKLKSAQARFESAQAGLERAQEKLTYTQIRAPYSGIVTQRHVEVGETASPGQPIMSGISLEQLRINVDEPQSLIPAVREGKAVRVYLPDGKQIGATRITVFPIADVGSNTFKVRIELPAGIKQLFPGMLVKTGFVIGEKRELVVPKEAVVYRSEVTGVYVLNGDNRLHFRQIRVGRALDDALVVLAGVDEGERIALDPIAAGVALKAQLLGEAHG
jgi:RND family efflux transporter MFP subunit